MFRRSLILGLTSLPFFATVAKSEEKKTVRWKVPSNVKKVRVRAWNKDGKEVLDTNLKVVPEQIFQIDVIDN
jgi:hypothetical protein